MKSAGSHIIPVDAWYHVHFGLGLIPDSVVEVVAVSIVETPVPVMAPASDSVLAVPPVAVPLVTVPVVVTTPVVAPDEVLMIDASLVPDVELATEVALPLASPAVPPVSLVPSPPKSAVLVPEVPAPVLVMPSTLSVLLVIVLMPVAVSSTSGSNGGKGGGGDWIGHTDDAVPVTWYTLQCKSGA